MVFVVKIHTGGGISVCHDNHVELHFLLLHTHTTRASWRQTHSIYLTLLPIDVFMQFGSRIARESNRENFGSNQAA
jgi:hypothetical protein